MLVMKTSSLESPARLRSPSSLFPAAPTKGLPDWSSSPPGASPTSMTPDLPDPSPGTAFFLLLQRSHFLQVLTSSATSARRNSESMNAGDQLRVLYVSPWTFARDDGRVGVEEARASLDRSGSSDARAVSRDGGLRVWQGLRSRRRGCHGPRNGGGELRAGLGDRVASVRRFSGPRSGGSSHTSSPA